MLIWEIREAFSKNLKRLQTICGKRLWTHYDVTKYLGGTDYEDSLDSLKSQDVS